ncbi:MAG TPA: hypothetical protein VH164_05565 [Ktedonobacteraceae bacterium]|nr:hypothetical protein [Ktedonobacteraceae bacterium]
MSQKSNPNKQDIEDDEEYSDMEMLEILESIREDMEELGMTSLQEVIARIEEINQRLDAR